MGTDLPKLRGEFHLAFDRLANGPKTTERSYAVSDRCAPGRLRSETLPHRFAAVPGFMKPDEW